MFKALLSDVDGTLLPNRKDGLPSPAVIDAITKCQGKVHVGIATSRPLFMLTEVFKRLPLSGPCIISGGSQIYDASTQQIVWERKMELATMERVFTVLKQAHVDFFINNGLADVPYTPSYQTERSIGIFVPDIEPTLAEELHQQLKLIDEIAPHQIVSHTPGKIVLDITHALATKQHGVLEVAKLLDIEPSEIIGVGDGYNDFPLLMACGLKVAMGNAVEDLKAIADYVAPTVDQDGLADVINKFVLNSD